jgi:aspartyl-tRNA synthetase
VHTARDLARCDLPSQGKKSVTRLDAQGSLRPTHTCGELRPDRVGAEVVLCGWVHRRRDHGGVIFVDLRDREGLTQVVFKPDSAPQAHERAQALRNEWVLLVVGRVEARDPEAVNSKLPTGGVEVLASELRILNTATPPPFPVDDEAEIDDEVRLRNRIHDLRRPVMQRRLEVRHRLLQSARAACVELGLLEIETPNLTRATPEGARDFLVPSRIHPGNFYALPQSPQIMKQLLMIAGLGGYFQIARCFRDEDQRADRQLEFTQIDLEMAFVRVEDVLDVLEKITLRTFRDVLGVELEHPFPRLTYAEAMARYGSDRPDTRIQLELVDLSDIAAESGFKVFAEVVANGGSVRALPIPDAGQLTRGELDRLEGRVQEWGAKGLAWVRIQEDGAWQSPIAKFLSDEEQGRIAERARLEPGHLILFVADRDALVCDVLSRLRIELGERLQRYDGRAWDPLFVVEFPVFEVDEEGRFGYMHMPFVAPVDEDVEKLRTDPASVRGTHYDLVLNGVELGSGSLRNHRSDLQIEIFKVLGYPEDECRRRFGFMLDALDMGAPPHGGFAFGFDRLCLLMAGGQSLRDVIAFPKTQRGQDLFMQSPSGVDADQLRELGLRLRRGVSAEED